MKDSINMIKYGFLRVCMFTPTIVIGDFKHNTDKIIKIIKQYKDSQVILFPSGSIIGFTLGDALFEKSIYDGIKLSLVNIASATIDSDALIIIGTAMEIESHIYDCAVVIYHGNILGVSIKKNINYEFCRYYTSGIYAPSIMHIDDNIVPVGVDLMYMCSNYELFKFTICIGNDIDLKCLDTGENLIIHFGENFHIIDSQNEELYKLQYLSKKLNCTIVSLNPSMYESTTDFVYSGSGYVISCGNIIGIKKPFEFDHFKSLIDLEMGVVSRMKFTTNFICNKYKKINFNYDYDTLYITQEELKSLYSSAPFVPDNKLVKESICNEVVKIQVTALVKRMLAVKCDYIVIGISGGLDSTLALLICAYACDSLKIDRKNIIAVTMPGFGTSNMTYNNAYNIIKIIGATLKTIDIKDAVKLHLMNIGHDINNYNVTFENAQARERTQILMDIANDNNAMVIGTGDLSELAIGWETYNGDHMSMYNINSGVPKTLIREIVEILLQNSNDDMSKILFNIINTPISPELLPLNHDGSIAQKTEKKVGPYILNDFYLYYMLKHGFSPAKIYNMAVILFEGLFASDIILKWEKIFYKRFFSNQYKRSCMPDGPKVLCIDMSPRTSLKLPSDISSNIWIEELEQI